MQNRIEDQNVLDNNVAETEEQLTRELFEAAASSMGFWDNSWDDADWNDDKSIIDLKIKPTSWTQNL